jgi:glycosyltransferase involved in cell wall biosynthesis
MKPDFLVFSGEEWSPFSQRCQSIAVEFARRGHRVFYFEPMLSVPKALNWLMKGRSLRPPDPGIAGLQVLRPKLSIFPFRGSRSERIDRILFAQWAERVQRRYSISPDSILYTNLPYWWGHILTPSSLPFAKLVYDCIDDVRIYSRTDRVLQIMKDAEEAIAARADLVLATAESLRHRMEAFRMEVHLLPNGVNAERFLAVSTSDSSPSDMDGIPHPRFGFVGALYHWIDPAVFETLAKAYPDGSVVLVGPARLEGLHDILKRNPNIHYLGARPYDQIPAYMAAFDVCLNPFRMDALGDTINPLKVYEYLCLGKPVLSALTRETELLAPYLYLYRDPRELIVAARQALSDPVSQREERRRFARSCSWSQRVDCIEKWLKIPPHSIGRCP